MGNANVTPRAKTPMLNRQQSTAPSFADVARLNASSPAQKRRQSNGDGNAAKMTKFEAPKPKVGTKSSTVQLNIVKPIVKPTPVEKPSFNRAIWVSRFGPMTEPSTIVNYVHCERYTSCLERRAKCACVSVQ